MIVTSSSGILVANAQAGQKRAAQVLTNFKSWISDRDDRDTDAVNSEGACTRAPVVHPGSRLSGIQGACAE